MTSLGAWFLYVPYKKNKILNITNKDNDIERVESPTESDGDTIESNIRTKSYKALSKNDNSDEELKEFVELENKIMDNRIKVERRIKVMRRIKVVRRK